MIFHYFRFITVSLKIGYQFWLWHIRYIYIYTYILYTFKIYIYLHSMSLLNGQTYIAYSYYRSNLCFKCYYKLVSFCKSVNKYLTIKKPI